MKKVRLGKNLIVELPDNFKPRPLPWYRRWLKALRSGKFSQAKGGLKGKARKPFTKDGELHDVVGHCCLGVLSEIQGRLTESGSDNGEDSGVLSNSNPCYFALTKCNIEKDRFTGQFFSVREQNASGEFPDTVKVFYKGKQRFDLASLNDNGATFLTIAKLIELLWKPRK